MRKRYRDDEESRSWSEDSLEKFSNDFERENFCLIPHQAQLSFYRMRDIKSTIREVWYSRI